MAQPFENRKPDQVAYVVPDLESAVQRMGRLLHIPHWNVWDYGMGYVTHLSYLGEPATYRSLVAMPAYGAALEIIQPIEGPSIYTTFLEERGAGLHHVGYYVPSIEETRPHFRALGAEEVMNGGGHGLDDDGEFAFFDLRDVVGSYVEMIEAPARRALAHGTIAVRAE